MIHNKKGSKSNQKILKNMDEEKGFNSGTGRKSVNS